jgi:hypothetical protein
VNFEFDDGGTVIWNTTISAGTKRARLRSRFAPRASEQTQRSTAITGALGGNTDDGTLNFEKASSFPLPSRS